MGIQGCGEVARGGEGVNRFFTHPLGRLWTAYYVGLDTAFKESSSIQFFIGKSSVIL